MLITGNITILEKISCHKRKKGFGHVHIYKTKDDGKKFRKDNLEKLECKANQIKIIFINPSIIVNIVVKSDITHIKDFFNDDISTKSTLKTDQPKNINRHQTINAKCKGEISQFCESLKIIGCPKLVDNYIRQTLNLHYLTHLTIIDCRIQSLTVLTCSNIVANLLSLDLSNNYLTYLPPLLFYGSSNPKLKYLNLSNNPIKEIPYSLPYSLPHSLQILLLENVEIYHLPPNFHRLSQLQTFSISPKLHTLPKNMSGMYNLRNLSVHSNTWLFDETIPICRQYNDVCPQQIACMPSSLFYLASECLLQNKCFRKNSLPATILYSMDYPMHEQTSNCDYKRVSFNCMFPSLRELDGLRQNEIWVN